MGRRLARECALQILFQYDFTKKRPDAESMEEFWAQKNVNPSIKKFAEELFFGTIDNLDYIDNLISSVALNWSLERMAFVDRNILRLATYELLYRRDIPPAVTINEALEIARKYSTEEAPQFINGILDRIHRLVQSQSRDEMVIKKE